MDVKTGSGAFMAKESDARALARTLVDVANGAGLKTTALITDMDEPLASAAGNAVEVMNAVDYLTGKHRDPRLHEVTLALGAELLANNGLTSSVANGRKALQIILDSGAATEQFSRMVAELGGPKDFVERAGKHLAAAPVKLDVFAERSGTVAAIDTRALGIAVITLGGGRRVPTDAIDHAVGLTGLAGKGTKVDKSTPLCVVHARSKTAAEAVAAEVRAAYKLGAAPEVGKPVRARIKATQ